MAAGSANAAPQPLFFCVDVLFRGLLKRLDELAPLDDGHHEAQKALAESLMKEIVASGANLDAWTDPTADVFPRPVSVMSMVQTYRGTPEDDEVRSTLAHELCAEILEAAGSDDEAGMLELTVSLFKSLLGGFGCTASYPCLGDR